MLRNRVQGEMDGQTWQGMHEVTQQETSRRLDRNRWYNGQIRKLKTLLGSVAYAEVQESLQSRLHGNVEQQLSQWQGYIQARGLLTRQEMAEVQWTYPGHPADVAEAERDAEYRRHCKALFELVMAEVKRHNPDEPGIAEREALKVYNRMNKSGDRLNMLKLWAHDCAIAGVLPPEWLGGPTIAEAVQAAKQAVLNLCNKMRNPVEENKGVGLL
jgi:hypothetical protein